MEYDPNNPAARIAGQIAAKYMFSYAMTVNLEAIANKLLPKLTEDEAIDAMDDLIENMIEEYDRRGIIE